MVGTDLAITAPGSAPGELEYAVVEGEGVLQRADGSQEPMGPGTYLLEAGDGVIENPTPPTSAPTTPTSR